MWLILIILTIGAALGAALLMIYILGGLDD